MESREASEAKAPAAADGLDPMKPRGAAEVVSEGLSEMSAYARLPAARRSRIRASNAVERLNRGSAGAPARSGPSPT